MFRPALLSDFSRALRPNLKFVLKTLQSSNFHFLSWGNQHFMKSLLASLGWKLNCKRLHAYLFFSSCLFALFFSFRRRSLNVTEPVTCYLFLFGHRCVIPPNLIFLCVSLLSWRPSLLAAAHLDLISVALHVMHDWSVHTLWTLGPTLDRCQWNSWCSCRPAPVARNVHCCDSEAKVLCSM